MLQVFWRIIDLGITKKFWAGQESIEDRNLIKKFFAEFGIKPGPYALVCRRAIIGPPSPGSYNLILSYIRGDV